MLALIFLYAIFALCVGIVLYGRRNYGTLENCGFPVVPTTLFIGSNPSLHKDVIHEVDIKRFRKYGRIWGAYEGKTPQVFVCDPELVRLIFVKEHTYFYDRRDPDLGSPVMNELLDFLPGEKWKTLRAAISPIFTTSKLKYMTGVIEAHAREYIKDLKEECKESGSIRFDCKRRISTWFLDTFARSTLGVQLKEAKDPNNEFATAFRVLVGEDIDYGFLYTLSMTFPFLTHLSPTFDHEPSKLIEQVLRQILENRRSSGKTSKNPDDFVDVLNSLWARVESPEFKSLGITQSTVISQAIAVFLGASDASTTSSSHLFYYIAKDPSIQDRLYAEIMSRFPDPAAILDHEGIKEENTPYLTACINESLRIAPSVIRPERVCGKDWAYEGIRIKKGTMVILPSWAGHRDPEFYPEPDSFRPDRFLPANRGRIHPYAFGAFGYGPRNCIGSRFAYVVMKIFLIHMLRNFRFELRPDTQLKYKSGVLLMSCLVPLYLQMVPR